MNYRLILPIFLITQLGNLSAEPTPQHEWTATSGHKTSGRAVSATTTTVTLELANGKTISLALEKLVPEDRTFIFDHFKITPPKEGDPHRSGAAQLSQENAPHPLGKISGPFQSAPGSSYYIYLPKSLKQGRKAPLLHFNGSSGGQPKSFQPYLSGVERFGWIMVASVESANKNPGETNQKHAADNVAHLKQSPLVAHDRIYFTGHSGGGAMSWWNAATLDGAGTLPLMSYIPGAIRINKGHHFVLIGATDFNRYTSCSAAACFHEDGFLRAYPGGHAYPPSNAPHIMGEGIAWLTAKYLQKNSSDKNLAEERLDYEAAMIDWINELTPGNPYQAYHLTQLLTKVYGISGQNAKVLSVIQSKLAAVPSHKSYHEGIMEIHGFGTGLFISNAPSGSVKGYNNSEHASQATALAKKYAGIPFVEETFTELAKPTTK